MEDFNTKLIGIKGILINSFEEIANNLVLHVSTEPTHPRCPCCRSSHVYVHDYRTQMVKDLPFRGKAVVFHLKKRRYRCNCCSKPLL